MTALDAEDRRRQALLSGDAAALESLLAPELVYVHSTGVRDTRDSYVAKIRDGVLQYLHLAFQDLQAQPVGADLAVVTGRMEATVRRDGQDRAVRSLFLTVWTRRPSDGTWRLVAHQGMPLA